ncbi:MAG: Cytochrome bo(3) ubiquinol oxidase subunit 3 [Verrucomicrobia subdivision 3 bacterium]|nr:Cytochrome bo(3) ubiquinol oxidase subunit 3 [Limisphaerales bacterium]MCS1417272.1 Cytochrome bo(3) ubiquinol oxidase subunit 3 [Limisphaerales bacterium]
MEIPYVTEPRKDTGLYNAKVGIWLFLASEVMLFGAFFSSYILLRVGAVEGTWPTGLLNVPIGTFNTIVLIVSSVTVVLAWSALKLNKFGQYKFFQAITVICALIFVIVKSFEYRDKFTHYDVVMTDGSRVDGHLIEKTNDYIILNHPVSYPAEKGDDDHAEDHGDDHSHSHDITTIQIADIERMVNWGPWANTYLAIYFIMTALHALHVIGGALVIAYLWGPGARIWKTDPERYINRVEVSGLFWHFVDLVWIFLFPVLYLL